MLSAGFVEMHDRSEAFQLFLDFLYYGEALSVRRMPLSKMLRLRRSLTNNPWNRLIVQLTIEVMEIHVLRKRISIFALQKFTSSIEIELIILHIRFILLRHNLKARILFAKILLSHDLFLQADFQVLLVCCES